jgi:hypothetical protein
MRDNVFLLNCGRWIDQIIALWTANIGSYGIPDLEAVRTWSGDWT